MNYIISDYIARYIKNTTGSQPQSYSEAVYFPQGEDFFTRFLAELEAAKKSITIEFYTIKKGKMWDEILAVLLKKVSEGVQIRVTYDGFGSLFSLPLNYCKTLQKQGVECEVHGLFKLRRNHRKTAVIDDEILFCGGMNLADKYINAQPEVIKTGHWKDSAVMVRKSRRGELCSPDNTERHTERPRHTFWHDSHANNQNISKQIMLTFINRASDYVYIITPYLVPCKEVLNALCAAAQAGTDVRIMLPFIPDKRLISAITKSNYLPLLEAGARLFEYPPGFIHSKNIVADDSRAAVSTVNFDNRSFFMNSECGVYFHGENSAIIADIKQDFLETQKNSREVTLGTHLKTGLFQRGVRRFCRIFSPLV
jgi:cardiolipin synthase